MQIDLVGIRDDNRTDLGECKLGRRAVDTVSGRGTRTQAERLSNTQGATLARRYFVRRKPKSVAKADAKDWYSLEDLYAL